MQDTFDQWAIVELMGHQRIAGRVTEQVLGGSSFVRVDVPAANDNAAFTRLLGNSAIYAINIVSENIARQAAQSFRAVPVTPYELPALQQKQMFDELKPYGDHED